MHVTKYFLGHRMFCALQIYDLHLERGNIIAASQLSPLGQAQEERDRAALGCVVSAARAAALEPGKGKCICNSTAPPVSFQPFSSHLACSRFSELCGRCEQ